MLGLVLVGELCFKSVVLLPTTAANYQVEATLENASKQKLVLWSPHNTEGTDCLSFLVEVNGKEKRLKPASPPRAAGVATAISLNPHHSLVLQSISFGECAKAAKLPPGRYKVRLVYSNSLNARDSVAGVWIGTIRSKPIQIDYR